MSVLPLQVIESLKQYEELMLKKRAIENELEALKSELIPKLPRETEIGTETGFFVVACRDKWTYSRETRALKENLKSAEKLEQQNGVAVAEPGEPYLVYREK